MMAETTYGVRKYTCSAKTKRPQKGSQNLEKLEKRNSTQRRLYITLDNIDEIFSENDDKYPVCYALIFNTIQGKVTKYFNGRSYDRKKELSYDCMNVLYSTLKRKLLRMKDAQGLLNPPPVLFFYLSQFFRYVELVVFSVVHYGQQDLKYMVQEPEDFAIDAMQGEEDGFISKDEMDDYILDPKTLLNDDKVMLETEDTDNSDRIKKCIDSNKLLSDREKSVLFRIYKNSYSSFGSKALTNRDNEVLIGIQNRLKNDPALLKDLEEILNA